LEADVPGVSRNAAEVEFSAELEREAAVDAALGGDTSDGDCSAAGASMEESSVSGADEASFA
jgi:hypothetical protein